MVLLDKYGADAIRLYMLNSSAVRGEDLRFSEKGLIETTRQQLLPLWNALSFLTTYAKIDGWEPTPENLLVEKNNPMDLWIISRLQKLIDEVKKEYNLDNDKICLSGFSQGCMMSINLGLTADKEYNCIVGFSGKIIDPEDLKLRKKVATSTLLIHGDADQVVMPNFLLEAKDFFIRNDIEIETHIIKNCDHHIPIEASSIALNYILKKF